MIVYTVNFPKAQGLCLHLMVYKHYPSYEELRQENLTLISDEPKEIQLIEQKCNAVGTKTLLQF
jgi:hypothetical protein